jgi:hypothetical protein
MIIENGEKRILYENMRVPIYTHNENLIKIFRSRTVATMHYLDFRIYTRVLKREYQSQFSELFYIVKVEL